MFCLLYCISRGNWSIEIREDEKNYLGSKGLLLLGPHMTSVTESKNTTDSEKTPDSTTLFGSLAVMIHTHWELLSYWIGKLGDVKVPEGPCRFDPHVFTATV